MFFHVDVIIYFVLTCCADSKVSERLAAYPLLRSFLRGRLVVLAPFPALFRSLRQRGSAPASSCSGQAIEGLYGHQDGETVLHTAFQLPKPMFEFVFEGELFAFIVNGDRFVLLALLPRRKPRTDRSVQPPFHSVIELNLTT